MGTLLSDIPWILLAPNRLEDLSSRRVIRVVKTGVQTVSQAAAETLLRLVSELGPGDQRAFIDLSGVHMPLRVVRSHDRPAGSFYFVGQHHESGVGPRREPLADPEIEFVRIPSGEWIPVTCRTPWGFVVTCDSGSSLRLLRPVEQFRLVTLADAWLANVASNLNSHRLFAEEIRAISEYAAE